MTDSGLVRVVAEGGCTAADTVPADEKCAMAEPGLAGRVLVVVVMALF